MREASGWTSRADYARFLSLQHAARAPVEAWLAQHADDPLRPPAQCPLIARDLERLNCEIPADAREFTLPDNDQHEGHVLGAAWVLAGSSLGNRAILKELDRAGRTEGGEDWPHAFLASDTMLAYWKGLRKRIERPADVHEVDAASHAAAAVFDHFIHCAQNAPNTTDMLVA
ncbi:MAG: biliverdin-producing heme oxygenase [Pseudomonadota bacterium]